MKKIYNKPSMMVIGICQQGHICIDSVNSSNTDVTYDGPGNGPARSRWFDTLEMETPDEKDDETDWDDDDEYDSATQRG